MSTNVGSYLLRDLKDQALPEAISWWPQTIGWQIVGLIFFVWLMVIAFKQGRQYWLNRYRKEALIALDSLDLTTPNKAINEFHQITNLVIKHAFPKTSSQQSSGEKLATFLQATTKQSLKQELLTAWHFALLKPTEIENWQAEHITELRGEISHWISTHEPALLGDKL